VRITGIEADAMRKEKEKKGGGAHEALDRLLEHPGQGHADLLPEAAQHQLGAHLSLAWTGMFFIKSGSGLEASRLCCRA
jgi:hypothetical protein